MLDRESSDTLYFRRWEIRLSAEKGLPEAISALAALKWAAAPRFFFEDSPGAPSGCAAITANHPDLARFAPPPHLARPGLSCWLSNLGSKWAPACPHAAGHSADWQVLESVAAGIGRAFVLSSANLIVGPVDWGQGGPVDEACAKEPRAGEAYFSSRFPAASYLASGVILQRLSSGSVNVTVTCQCRQESEAAPESVQKFLAALGAEPASRWIEIPGCLRVVGDPLLQLKPAEVMEKYRHGMAEIVRSLKLPHRLPAGQELLTVARAPLKNPRKTLAAVFARSGWKPADPQPPRGSHRFEKRTQAGHRLLLECDTGTMIAFLVTSLALVSKDGVFRLPAPASEMNLAQQLTPNPELFQMAAENTRALADHLEQTWIRELERALDDQR